MLPLSKSKSGFEALILIPAARRASGQGETLSDKLFAHIAPLGWEHIRFNGDDVWASEPLKQGVSALRNLSSAFLEAA